MLYSVNLHLFGYLILFFSCGICQNTTEIPEKKQEILNVMIWKVFRYLKFSSDEAGLKHRLYCYDCLNSKEWKGLRIDLFFEETITDFKIKNCMEINFRWNSKHVVLTAEDENSIPSKGPFCEFYIKFKHVKVPPANEEITSFYFNRDLLFGNRFLPDKRIQGTLPLGRRQCSVYAKTEEFGSKIGRISFDYLSFNRQEGIYLVVLFQQVLKSVKAKNLYTSQQAGNQWILESFGFELDKNETFKFELELEADDLISDPYPLSIVLNEETLCGLPSVERMQSKDSFSYKDFSEIKELNKNNSNLLYAIITLICLLTLMVIGCISYVVYLRKVYWQSMYRNSEINGDAQGNKQQRNFDDFVQTHYDNL